MDCLRKLKIWHEIVQCKWKVGIFATSNNIRRGGNTVNSARKSMNKRYNYKEAAEQIEKFRSMVGLYDCLIEAGIAKKDVQYFEFPRVSSGYSMGEKSFLYCNGKEVAMKDDRLYYSKSCKYQETHGRIYMTMTKRELKAYVDLCRNITILREREDRNRDESRQLEAYILERDEMVRKAVDMKKSVIKKLYI